jgi:hypothetical protein
MTYKKFKRPFPPLPLAPSAERRALRETLHARGILTLGIPRTVEPLSPTPTPEEIQALLTTAGLQRKRSPRQVQLACAAGYSRPVVESIIASLLSRGAAQLRYKGWHGAQVQLTMAVMAHKRGDGPSHPPGPPDHACPKIPPFAPSQAA